MSDFISTDDLAARLGEDGLVILDCTYFMSADARDGRAEYEKAHIPGARHFDIDKVSDPDGQSPHMLPSPEDFAAAMRAIGVNDGDAVIVYDGSPLRSSARGWFMMRHFGVTDVKVLDGGFDKWRAEGLPVETGGGEDGAGNFSVKAASDAVVSKADLLAGVGCPLADARPLDRFDGSTPDPRAGVESGHIPGARNVPMTSLYAEDGTMKDADALRAIFDAAGLDPHAPFVASCGSGVTANSIILAARKIGGGSRAKLYDGSWSEWGADPDTPKATGAP